jgi:hypothetical protein
MAVPVVASSTSFADTTNQTSRTVNKPSGVASGDLLVIGVSIDTNATVTTPTGFTQIVNQVSVELDCRLAVFWRVADGSEGSTFTIASSSEIACGACIRITGADTTSPIDAVSVFNGSQNTTVSTILAPDIYDVYGDALILRMAGADNGAGDFTLPSAHTSIVLNPSSAASGAEFASCYKNSTGRGYIGNASFAYSATADGIVCTTILIKPAGGTAVYPSAPVIRGGEYYVSPGVAETAVLNVPYGTVDNDLLVLIGAATASGSMTIPAAFTTIHNLSNTAAYVQTAYRIASSEPSNYTVSPNSLNTRHQALLRIVGADTASPIDTSASNTGTSTSMTLASITPSVNNCLLLGVGGCDDDEISWNDTFTGYASHWTVSSTENADGGFALNYLEQATAAATGTASLTLDASEEWATSHFAIKPAASGGGGSASGSASLTTTASATGRTMRYADASASNSVSATATGRAVAAGVASASATVTDNVVGRTMVYGVASASCVVSGTATGASAATAATSAALALAALGVGASKHAAEGTANGAAVASGIGSADTEGIGAVSLSVVATATGAALSIAGAQASVVSSCAATGAAKAEAEATASASVAGSGIFIASALMEATAAIEFDAFANSTGGLSSVASAAIATTATAIGASIAQADASAICELDANGTGYGAAPMAASGSVSAAAAGEGASYFEAVASANVATTAIAYASGSAGSTAASIGQVTATAVGASRAEATGSATNALIANGVGAGKASATASATTQTTANADILAHGLMVGSATGAVNAQAVSSARAEAVAEAQIVVSALAQQDSSGVVTPEERALSIEVNILSENMAISILPYYLDVRIESQQITTELRLIT